MPFGNYHIVIFKEKSGGRRNMRVRGWLVLLFLLLVAGLGAGNYYLWGYYSKARALEVKLSEAERSLEERQTQLGGMMTELGRVRTDLLRVQQFDTKLRLMMDMDAELPETGIPGQEAEAMGLGYLPMHRQELAARKMRAFLQDLSGAVQLEEVRQQELLLAMRANKEMLAVMPSIWPTEGFVTSQFGTRRSPFTGKYETHKGMDISARMGHPIYAPARGVVTFAGNDGAYGISVDIKHGGGLTTKYGHMQKFVVEVGQTVERGDLIGHVGRTGRVTGPHLHYEVRLNGVPTDPTRFILN